MKAINKIISTFLLATLMLHCWFITVGATSNENLNTIDLTEFSEQLGEMVRSNNEDRNISILEATSQNDDSIMVSEKRLIVKTYSNEPLTNDCGAVDKIEGYNKLHILQYSSNDDATSAFEFYEIQSYVEYVEYDFTFGTTTEAYTEVDNTLENAEFLSWGSESVGASAILNIISEYNLTLKEEVVVAIFDSGLQKNHAYFNSSRIIDSERNVSASANESNKNDTNDNLGHGTHVAGMVYNNTPENVKISPYKITDNNNDFSYSQIATLILEADNSGADVINMSFECLVIYENNDYKTFHENVDTVTEHGVVVVAAAGNSQKNAKNILPAYLENVVTVSATTQSNAPWRSIPHVMGSNFGDCVDIAAPGVDIVSTGLNSNSVRMDGTSQAAPFVSAAVAIIKLLDINDNLTAYQIKDILKETAYKPFGWNPKYGSGIVNFVNMVDCFERLQSPIINVDDEEISIAAFPLSTQNITIFYTIDGSFPDPRTAYLYNAPIITSNPNVKTVTAVAYCDGFIFSKPSSYTVRWSTSYVNLWYKDSTDLVVSGQNISVLKWTSDNPDIVSVDNGEITGIKRGTATIIASISGGRSAVFEVKVTYSFWQWLIVIFLFGWAWY